MALPEGLSLGQKVRKDALIANPEEFGAIGTMSPPRCREDQQGIPGMINHGTNSLQTWRGEPKDWRLLWKRDFSRGEGGAGAAPSSDCSG